MIVQGFGFSTVPQVASALKLALMVAVVLLCSCNRTLEEGTAPAPAANSRPMIILQSTPIDTKLMDTKLDDPSQLIMSPVSELRIRQNKPITIPITITNKSRYPWSSTGAHPVNVSYHWNIGLEGLPDEGLRTKLPDVLKPGESVSLTMAVMPPSRGKKLTLVVTAVQEGNAWFDRLGGRPLKIPARVSF